MFKKAALIKDLKDKSLSDLGTLLSFSAKLHAYYLSVNNDKASRIEVVITNEVKKEMHRRQTYERS